MNPVLALGQIVVSIFLIIAILMQSRGIGLSSASSVLRSLGLACQAESCHRVKGC